MRAVGAALDGWVTCNLSLIHVLAVCLHDAADRAVMSSAVWALHSRMRGKAAAVLAV
jgi:hypothetical protein